jgi:hypothetical protein
MTPPHLLNPMMKINSLKVRLYIFLCFAMHD